VEDLVPKLLPMASVQKVLQNLLRERVSIRDGASILEALGEAAMLTRNPALLTEYVRQSIRRVVVKPYLDANGALAAYLLDPAVERPLEAAIEHGETASHLNWPPQKIRELADRVARAAGGSATASVLVCGSGVRHFLRQILEGGLPGMAVLSHNEIPPGVQVISLGTVQ
jgi:flagellar biosynthesis protein FlhA